ncbi:hypothetical protein SGFS_006790 [Streptomyces graminofaciens]|uniref:Uncharacterized protein n=1 Tax=Streptomyces graminofaciens TaxID=68212 RepID=A0ABM7F0Z1_9ACTN|nr:Imm10 family immunity protein [Streptomyces graminofaciens]BBC29385.1 hypothetical protein SGFS_006790 [Streptomyces graminofaciens]
MPSRHGWVVRKISIEENLPDSVFTVGLAEDEAGQGCYLVFQCGLEEPSEQNRRLGLDSYCILNESGGVDYGGVEEVSISQNRLTLRFREEAIEELELPNENIVLAFHSGSDMAGLRIGLGRILSYGDPEKFPRVMNL